MDKSFEPQTFETRLYAFWEANGCFKPSGHGTPYTIMLPPPNVTGTLHMGHAFQHTLQDALIRYHRMRGYDTLWQMGSDHAGIATEMVVARNLALEGMAHVQRAGDVRRRQHDRVRPAVAGGLEAAAHFPECIPLGLEGLRLETLVHVRTVPRMRRV